MELRREDITEQIMAVKISRSYREDLRAAALYDATRGYWKVDLRRAEQAEYVFSIYRGAVKEVYSIHAWLPAGTIPRPTLPDAEIPAGRYEFTGSVAEPAVRNKYLGKSVAGLYRRGDASPVRYFFH